MPTAPALRQFLDAWRAHGPVVLRDISAALDRLEDDATALTGTSYDRSPVSTGTHYSDPTKTVALAAVVDELEPARHDDTAHARRLHNEATALARRIAVDLTRLRRIIGEQVPVCQAPTCIEPLTRWDSRWCGTCDAYIGRTGLVPTPRQIRDRSAARQRRL